MADLTPPGPRSPDPTQPDAGTNSLRPPSPDAVPGSRCEICHRLNSQSGRYAKNIHELHGECNKRTSAGYTACLKIGMQKLLKYKVAFERMFVKYKHTLDTLEAERKAHQLTLERTLRSTYPLSHLTKRIELWTTKTFGTKFVTDPWERSMRVVEEAMELAQTQGVTAVEILRLVDYVFNRPTGEVSQETGGLQVCILALARAIDVDIEDVLLKEVERLEKLDPSKPRAKQELKHSRGVGIPLEG